MSGSVIEFKNVNKSFGLLKVLRNLNMNIPENKITFIIGRSGEGKSVLLKHCIGILQPTSGSIKISGREMTGEGKEAWQEIRKSIGLLFQDGALFDNDTVAGNVAFALREFTNKSAEELTEEVRRLLELVGLEGIEKKYPSQISIGEKKRVGLARALSMSPKILLYDEPTTSMDPLVSELIDELIVKIHKSRAGISSVVISHDIRSVMSVAEHVILLHEGAVYFEGPPQSFKDSADPVVKQFITGTKEGPLSRIIG